MSRIPACFVELSKEVLEFEVKLDFTVFSSLSLFFNILLSKIFLSTLDFF